MLENIILKIASLSDIAAIDRVGKNLFDNSTKTDRTKEFLKDERHHLALSYLGDKIIGMASGVHYVHPDKEPALFINEVGVIEEYQNKGIGRALVRYLCDHGRMLGCKEAWVLTDATNEMAIRSYLAAGGTISSERIVMVDFDLTNTGEQNI